MSDTANSIHVLPSPAGPSQHGPKSPDGRQGPRGFIDHFLPSLLAVGVVAALAYVGVRTGGTMPKFSVLTGNGRVEEEAWCGEHSVPDAVCVECRKECMPADPQRGWCRTHGVHECPLCHPTVAQLAYPPTVTQDDRDRATRALEAVRRVENNSKCKLQQRRIQFTSADAVSRLGIETGMVSRAAITEGVMANGEILYDQSRVARVSSRLPGVVVQVERRAGDRVRAGDVLALVDAADVGKAKAEFQQALVQLDLKVQNLAGLRDASGAIPEKHVQEAQSAVEEAEIRLLTAQQSLINLGLPIPKDGFKGLRPAEVSQKMQFFGIPDEVAKRLGTQTSSANLVAVTAPLDGLVVERDVVASERVDSAKVLFTVADTRHMWLMLRVRLEDANLLRPGLAVRFRHAGHGETDTGVVSWISPSVDEKSRTAQVRVELPNADGDHRARTFGSAQVVLREEAKAIVVPSEAVHWEGDCHVVFVRDKNFEQEDSPKVFHVRKVRPGARDNANTEIIAGVLPGEMVATKGSGILRSELLKNNLGAG